jgi:hypothetical protein
LTCINESGWCSREWAARFWKVPTLPASFKLKDIFLDFCVACLDVYRLDIWTIVVERKKKPGYNLYAGKSPWVTALLE